MPQGVAPAGTPRERIAQVAAAAGRVLATEAVRQRLLAAGLEPVASSGPAEFGEGVGSETARWGALVQRAGISLQ